MKPKPGMTTTSGENELNSARYEAVRELGMDEFANVVRRAIGRHWATETYEAAFDRILDELMEEKRKEEQ